MKYVCSKNYKILCREDCFHVKNMKEENKVWFDTIEEGFEYGCRICKDCRRNINRKLFRIYRGEIINLVLEASYNAPSKPFWEFSTQEEQYNKKVSEYCESIKPEIMQRLKELGFITDNLKI
jgi:methylphosphotriester-DNA--protein-cysteine methyltransferase